MATIVNNPGTSTADSSGANTVLIATAIILIAAVVFLLFAARSGGFNLRGISVPGNPVPQAPSNINNNEYNPGAGTENNPGGVTIPEKVDINVNTPGQ